MNLTDAQLYTLRHMLGINNPSARIPEPYRDYAAVNPGDQEFAALERIGAVECYRRADSATRYDWFKCSAVGRVAAIASHRRIRLSKSRRRYSRWLHLSDALPGVTFRDFLTRPEFRDIVAAA